MGGIGQDHVLRVLWSFLAEPPTSFHPETIRSEKRKLICASRPLHEDEELAANAVRGQDRRGGTR